METVILDASAVIEMLRGTPTGIEIGKWALDRNAVIPSLASFEVLRGSGSARARSFLHALPDAFFNLLLAEEAAALEQRLIRQGKPSKRSTCSSPRRPLREALPL